VDEAAEVEMGARGFVNYRWVLLASAVLGRCCASESKKVLGWFSTILYHGNSGIIQGWIETTFPSIGSEHGSWFKV
jgi:hypothetical protein